MSETNVNESKSDAVEVKTYSEEQFKGLLADKQAEVKKRQDAEKQIADLQAKLENNPSTSSGQAGSGQADDRPMTVAEFKQLMAEQQKNDAERNFRLLEFESTQKAISDMTAEKCGDGLDFNSVIAAGESNLTEGDKLAIRQSKNPAAEKYRRCLMLTDELREKTETYRTSQMLENVKLKGRVPATGSADTTVATNDISKMSQEQLDQLAESLD